MVDPAVRERANEVLSEVVGAMGDARVEIAMLSEVVSRVLGLGLDAEEIAGGEVANALTALTTKETGLDLLLPGLQVMALDEDSEIWLSDEPASEVMASSHNLRQQGLTFPVQEGWKEGPGMLMTFAAIVDLRLLVNDGNPLFINAYWSPLQRLAQAMYDSNLFVDGSAEVRASYLAFVHRAAICEAAVRLVASAGRSERELREVLRAKDWSSPLSEAEFGVYVAAHENDVSVYA